MEPRTEPFTGYSIVNAERMEAAIELAQTNPMITSVVVDELARIQGCQFKRSRRQSHIGQEHSSGAGSVWCRLTVCLPTCIGTTACA